MESIGGFQWIPLNQKKKGKNKMANENLVTLADAGEVIKALLRDPEHSPALMLRGSPGVGKSTLVRDLARSLGVGFIDVRLAQMERVDFCGLPSVKDGTTEWNVPGIWPRDPGSKGILLLDELTSAPADVQVAAYQLVLERAISNSNYKLPSGWLIVGAGNLTTDRAVVKSMSSALANRFMHLNVETNLDVWCNWAARNEIHPSVTGFVRFRPELLFRMDGQNLEQGWPSPRSWEKVSNILAMGMSENLTAKAIYGLVGSGAGIEFLAFHKSNVFTADVVKMLEDPATPVVIPEKSKRSERFAFLSAVAYQLWAGGDDQHDTLRVEGLFRVLDKLTPDFAAMLLTAAQQGNKRLTELEAMEKIMACPACAAFAAKHESLAFNRPTL